ncbi:MAG: hypothetical protein LUH52_06065 [Bacteroides uniformis]|nr:hypothetical protein [Bacteroides uniformis]
MKQIIWSNDSFMDDEAREYYQDCQREYLEDDSYTVSDEEWGEEVCRWLDDERMNLNVQVDGVIIAFGDLGLWRGRRQGYQILGSNVADILHSSYIDSEWYGDCYNIRGRMTHHDGTNYALYRVAKSREDAERIAERIYNLEIDEKGFRKLTRSLYPYVADVYGWKVRWRKPA